MRKIKVNKKVKLSILVVFGILITASAFYLGKLSSLVSGSSISKPPVTALDSNNNSDTPIKKYLEKIEPESLPDNININKNYFILDCPDLLQNNESTCGVFASLSVLEYYGIDAYADKLSVQMKTTYENGTEMQDMVNIMKKYGLNCRMQQMTIGELKTSIDNKAPVIVMMQAYKPSGEYHEKDSLKAAEWGHYVVAIGYGENNIVFNDPGDYGRKYLSEKQFLARWKGLDEFRGKKPTLLNHYGIVVEGKEPVVPKITGKLKKNTIVL